MDLQLLFRRLRWHKSLSESISNKDRTVKRTLSITAIVSIIFFNVSGGPYALEEVIAAGPGLGLLLILVTPLVYSAPVALVCAELGTTLPEEGGYYAWSKRALGPFGAFCQGWWAWLFTFVDIGIFPTMFCDYMAFFVPSVGKDGDFWQRKAVMITMVWAFVLLNLRGAKTIGNFARIFVVMVLSPFVIMVVAGIYRGMMTGFPLSPMTPMLTPGMTYGTALAAAIPVILWNYQGWDAISTVAGEMDNPRRNYPRGLIFAIILIATMYVIPALIAFSLVGTVDVKWNTGAWSIAGGKIAGPWLANLTSAMGMISAVGMYSGLVLVYSRVPFVMGRDGYLPQVLMKRNSRDVPYVSLIVSGCIYTVIVLIFKDLEELAAADVTFYAAMMSLELMSFLVLRYREPHLNRPFLIPGGWLVAIPLCILPLACIGAGIWYRLAGHDVWEVIGKPLLVMSTGPLLYPIAAAHCKRLNFRRNAASAT